MDIDRALPGSLTAIEDLTPAPWLSDNSTVTAPAAEPEFLPAVETPAHHGTRSNMSFNSALDLLACAHDAEISILQKKVSEMADLLRGGNGDVLPGASTVSCGNGVKDEATPVQSHKPEIRAATARQRLQSVDENQHDTRCSLDMDKHKRIESTASANWSARGTQRSDQETVPGESTALEVYASQRASAESWCPVMPRDITSAAFPTGDKSMVSSIHGTDSIFSALFPRVNFEQCAVSECQPWERNWLTMVQLLLQHATMNTCQLHDTWDVAETYVRKVMKANHTCDIWCAAVVRKKKMRRAHDIKKSFHRISKSISTQGSLASAGHDRHHSHLESVRFAAVIGDPTSFWNEVKNRVELLRVMGLIAFLERFCVLVPHSGTRIVWVLLGMLCMLYDVIVLPLQAFDYTENLGLKWTTNVFWMGDILVTFFTGFYVDLELICRLRYIARHYAMSWLIFDSGVLFIPIIVEFHASGDDGKDSSALKMIRLLRFLRLVRLLKLNMLISESMKVVNSPSLVLVFKLLQLVLGLISFMHVNACMWYYLGKEEGGWIYKLSDEEVFYRYFSALHWVLTQFQGTSEIIPGRAGERAYAAGTVLVSLLIAAAFISNFTNIVMQLQSLQLDKDKQMQEIRRYLRAHRISKALSVRVRNYLAWKQTLDNEKAGEALSNISDQLVMELEFEIYQPVIGAHVFFCEFIDIYPRLSRRLVHQVLKTTYNSPGDLLFSAQESCFCIYFVVSGVLDYAVIIRRLDVSTTLDRLVVGSGDVLSEPALWMHWQHKGTLVVESYSQVVVLSSDMWRQIIPLHPPAHISCSLYARRLRHGMAVSHWRCTDIINPMAVISSDKTLSNSVTKILSHAD